MWDIQIGKKQTNICSAVICRRLGDGYDISRNQESYWVSESFLDVGMQIYRGTKEYDRLKALLDDVTIDDDTIRTWIDKTIVRHCPIGRLIQAIDEQKQAAYDEGRRSAKAEIRAVLNSD